MASRTKGGALFPMNCTHNCDRSAFNGSSSSTTLNITVVGKKLGDDNSDWVKERWFHPYLEKGGSSASCSDGKMCTIEFLEPPFCDTKHDGESNPCASDFSDYCCDCDCNHCGPLDYCLMYSPEKKHCRSCKPGTNHAVCKNYYTKRREASCANQLAKDPLPDDVVAKASTLKISAFSVAVVKMVVIALSLSVCFNF